VIDYDRMEDIVISEWKRTGEGFSFDTWLADIDRKRFVAFVLKDKSYGLKAISFKRRGKVRLIDWIIREIGWLNSTKRVCAVMIKHHAEKCKGAKAQVDYCIELIGELDDDQWDEFLSPGSMDVSNWKDEYGEYEYSLEELWDEMKIG
jgi:hypothetical protein